MSPSLSDPRAVTPTPTRDTHNAAVFLVVHLLHLQAIRLQDSEASCQMAAPPGCPPCPHAICHRAPRPPGEQPCQAPGPAASWLGRLGARLRACRLLAGQAGRQGSFGAQRGSPSHGLTLAGWSLVAAQGRALIWEGGRGLRGSPPRAKRQAHGIRFGGCAAGRTRRLTLPRPARGSGSEEPPLA